MNWRQWNNALHRDIGFLCIGLTLVYAISGVAVNHISQWNPSYRVERIETNIGPVSGNPTDAETIRTILARLVARCSDGGELAPRVVLDTAPEELRAVGLSRQKISYLKDLAEDCADDGVYEFFFCGPPLNLPGGCGSPINPQAIK